MSVLLVVAADRISTWLDKGEVVDRYYNPGNRFSEVHVLLLNDDQPNPALLQRLVGDASVTAHNLPAGPGLFGRSLGWRPALLARWAAPAVALARDLGVEVVRCYGPYLNLAVAMRLKRDLGLPYVVSLHTNPDVDLRGRRQDWRNWLGTRALRSLERQGLRAADLVLPVYEPIVPYLQRLGVQRYRVAYNMLNTASLVRKTDYALHDPVRVVCVGRQFAAKDPTALVEAVAESPGVQLTLVGDGELHEGLVDLAASTGAAARISFIKALDNDGVCALLHDSDVFAVVTEHWELSKAVLEAMLTGLPVIINRRRGEPVPELRNDLCLLVDGSADSYRLALEGLIADGARRRRLGVAAAEHAERHWSPSGTEAVFASVYDELLAARAGR